MSSTPATTNRVAQVISTSEIYSAAEFRRRANLRDFAWREARAAGLKTMRFGRKVYVAGSEWFRFLEAQEGQ